MRLSDDAQELIFDSEDERKVFQSKQEYWQYLHDKGTYTAEEIGEKMKAYSERRIRYVTGQLYLE